MQVVVTTTFMGKVSINLLVVSFEELKIKVVKEIIDLPFIVFIHDSSIVVPMLEEGFI